MRQMEEYCIIKLHAWRELFRHPPSRRGPLASAVFARLHSQKRSGGVASMTRDRGYPDWLVLSALLRLLRSGYHSAKYVYIYVGCVWLVAMCSLLLYIVIFVTSSIPVIVYTDHNPLVFLNSMRNSNQRLMRWCSFLQAFNLDVRHVRGRDNVLADTLSRL